MNFTLQMPTCIQCLIDNLRREWFGDNHNCIILVADALDEVINTLHINR